MKKAITILFLLLCLHLQVCAHWDDNEASKLDNLDDIWHISKPISYMLLLEFHEKDLANGDDYNIVYYIPPDASDDFTPIENWTRYVVGENDAPVIKACNGNRDLLKYINVYVTYRVSPIEWATDEAIRGRAEDKLRLEWYYNKYGSSYSTDNENTNQE